MILSDSQETLVTVDRLARILSGFGGPWGWSVDGLGVSILNLLLG